MLPSQIVKFDEGWTSTKHCLRNQCFLFGIKCTISHRPINSGAQAIVTWYDIGRKLDIRLVKLLCFASVGSVDLGTLHVSDLIMLAVSIWF